jgi:hypothetical protein
MDCWKGNLDLQLLKVPKVCEDGMVPLKLLSCRTLEGKIEEKNWNYQSVMCLTCIYVFVFLLEIKKLYYVCAIDDIIIKQLETADINVNVNPNICPCIYQFNAKSHVACIFNKLLWSRTKLFDNWRFSYKICKVAKLLISSGMGPVSPGLRVKLLQNISWPTRKVSFNGTNI